MIAPLLTLLFRAVVLYILAPVIWRTIMAGAYLVGVVFAFAALIICSLVDMDGDDT